MPAMVHLLTVENPLHARVIAARLGSDDILVQLRGSVDGPYPFGGTLVFVAADQAEEARDLLLADELAGGADAFSAE